MSCKPLPVLHVDGSLTEYVDKNGVLHKVAGIGGYLVVNGKILDQFSKKMENEPCLNYHENHAIIEGLKWVKSKGFETLNIKTDSLESVKLFQNMKKALTKEEKFFLAQFLLLEISYEWVEIQYFSRTDNDLAHKLSRVYLKSVDKNYKEIHHNKIMDKVDYDKQNAEICTDIRLRKALSSSVKEINHLLN
jgi:ribonuclease HI